MAMALFTFPGGVHPAEKKDLSKNSPIEKMYTPKQLMLYLSQSIGAPSELIVEVGQRVKTGQQIARNKGIISVPLHSPVTGTVKEIKKVMHPVQQKPMEAVIIETDEKGEELDYLTPIEDFSKSSNQELYTRILEAGIVGLGGATFPSHAKYIESLKKPIETVILNGAECEPYLTIDYRMMLEKTAEIVEGLKVLMKVSGAKNGIIGVEDNKPEAIEELRKFETDRIKIIALKTKYPQGAEKQLIYAATGKKVSVGAFPFSVGVIMQNVSTAFAVYEAVKLGKPLIERGVTITGEGIKSPKNVIAKVGTPVQEMIDFSDGFTGEVDKVISGGPMMGLALKDTSSSVMKGTSGILVMVKPEGKPIPEKPCINCGYCVFACPMNLEPNYMVKLIKSKQFDKAVEEAGLMSCMECGSCAYSCPSKIDHVKTFKTAKRVYSALKGRK